MAHPLQEKLHISGTDSRAAALTRQWRLGYETIAFSYAPLLDDPSSLPRAREDTAGIGRLWLHAPFAELTPCAIDPLVRDVAHRRFRQALEAAASSPTCTTRSGTWSSRYCSGGNFCGRCPGT